MKKQSQKTVASKRADAGNGVVAQEELRLAATVHARGLGTENWSEKAEVTSLSANGAGFTIERKCVVGNIVSVTLPLAHHLRSYDHDQKLYTVWGLVQYCHRSKHDKGARYYVGVAFVGKDAPESYHKNPLQHYRITGMNSAGFWKISETEGFKVRRDMRYRRSIELYLSRVDEKMRSLGGGRILTEDISRSGAAVITRLDLEVGDNVKFICEKFDFSSLAVVCGKNMADETTFRLHLKFVGGTFPIEKLKMTDEGLEKTPSRT